MWIVMAHHWWESIEFILEVDLKLGDVSPETVLSKFMENGEWDFHHVEGVRHNSLFAKHENDPRLGKSLSRSHRVVIDKDTTTAVTPPKSIMIDFGWSKNFQKSSTD